LLLRETRGDLPHNYRGFLLRENRKVAPTTIAVFFSPTREEDFPHNYRGFLLCENRKVPPTTTAALFSEKREGASHNYRDPLLRETRRNPYNYRGFPVHETRRFLPQPPRFSSPRTAK